MATFRCSSCGCNDDTALCNYWSARVRDMPPLCSACDPKIGKWHRQFPRLFGAFLVTPGPANSPRDVLARSVARLRWEDATWADATLHDDISGSASGRPAKPGVPAVGDMIDFDDPVPSYTASHFIRARHRSP